MIGGVAGMRGYKPADYLRKASACEGQELGAPSPPPSSAALGKHPHNSKHKYSSISSRFHGKANLLRRNTNSNYSSIQRNTNHQYTFHV